MKRALYMYTDGLTLAMLLYYGFVGAVSIEFQRLDHGDGGEVRQFGGGMSSFLIEVKFDRGPSASEPAHSIAAHCTALCLNSFTTLAYDTTSARRTACDGPRHNRFSSS